MHGNNYTITLDTISIGSIFETLGKIAIKFGENKLNNPLTLIQAKKIIRKNGLNKSARQLVREYGDDAIESIRCGNTLNNLGKKIGQVMLYVDLGYTIYSNFNSKSTTWVSETVVDISYILLQSAISGLCLAFIPGVGWLVGAGINLLMDYYVEETGVIDDVKEYVGQYDNTIKRILFGKALII